jgi:hypothetical protein
MNAVPLDKLLRHHFGCGKIEKMKVPKQSRKELLNRAKPSPQAVQQPPQSKGRVIPSPKPTWRFNFQH